MDRGLSNELAKLDELENEIRGLLNAASPDEETSAAEQAATATEDSAAATNEPLEPVDALAAADSLYLSGNYTGALTMYERSEGAKADDICWIRLQKANCLRWLGRASEAAGLYQTIITEYPENYWAQEAEWWLKSIQWQAEHRAR